MSVLEASLSLHPPNDFPPPKVKPEIISKEREEIIFLLCESCFWCASYFNNYRKVVSNCPTCDNEKVESMPISHDEIYTFNHDSKRGVTLGFYKWRSQLS
jgi:hypothetical protein